jgi:arginase
MPDPSSPEFDLVLSYPQWQGSGRSEHLRRGALAAAAVCGKYGPLVRVPDAGEGERDEGVNRWTAILAQFLSARELLQRHRPRTVLTAGGDCACDIAVIDYLHRRHPALTVVWVDAHLDANTPATTPSGNFHGMPVAALLGSPPEGLKAHLLSPGLDPARFKYVSAHLGDPGDWEFQRTRGLSWLDEAASVTGPVHVHFDLDVLDPAEFPHVAYPDGRLPAASGLALLRSVAATAQLVGLTITEFAPRDPAAATAGSRYLQSLCDASLGLRPPRE